jgi:predicted nucleic acid-binding Zn ribbon protein
VKDRLKGRPRPIARAIDRLLQGLGIATDVARVEAIDAWPAVAAGILGPDAAATRAIRTEGTTLVVTVPSPAWASEIRLREADLLARLEREAPRSGISALRTVPAHASSVGG